METNRVKELLENYFEGQTSLEEENMLHDYFASGEIDAELLPYKELFGGLKELQQDTSSVHEDDLMDFILESER